MNAVSDKPDSTELAIDRTWLAHERTLMAWVRTSTSMISFGFTIYKFFQFETANATHTGKGYFTPRDFALIIVTIGLVSLVLATFAHHKETRPLSTHLGKKRRSMAELVAFLVAGFGILVLVATFFRS